MTRFLHRERQTLDELLPGLDERLAGLPLSTLEGRESPGPELFREHGGPGLLVPREHAGLGVDPLRAVRVQRAIGARSPSLAVATTMHHFSIASLVETSEHSAGFEWMLLEAIARSGLLVASGFAEGRTGQAILAPTMRAQERDGRIVLNGSKRPCSLARSMDLLTASVALADGRLAIALIPKDTPGLTVKPFWDSFVLAGAQSDEVVLDDVEVPPDLVVRTEATAARPLDDLQTTGFLWFELLMSAAYLGAASALVERVLATPKADASVRAGVLVEVEGAMAAVEGVARGMSAELRGEAAFAQALVCRYATQDAIGRAAGRCVEALGGMAYLGSGDVAYLASAAAALAFHPPARAPMAQPLCDYYSGSPLRVS
ncbi:acyl-CoA dehydrogenase family protein [Amycolatopsis sp. GM8]|uniref:acyl-CoA dehydrogenase family protein n=1 Tax=Amycolatopsis sp. GM8 TaxID=2896530 RepID=UPI001F1E1080|nr:acyl-CoA dehydrogenase family protein [Amycolatopsis sp. GM8]